MNKLCIILMLLMYAVDTTALSTIFPQVVASLGEMSLYPFMGAGFLLAFVLATPVFGTVCDRIGGRRAGFAAVVIFLCGSALCGAASTMQQLIIARLIQGVGAGGMVNTGQFLVTRIYTLDSARSLMQAALSVVWACGSIFGPLIAAAITVEIGWRWVFFINLPIGLFVMYCLRFVPREQARATNEPFDFLGLGLFVSGSLLIFFGLQLLLAHDRLLVKSALLVPGVLLTLLFLVRSFRISAPLVPLKLLASPIIGVCVLFGLFTGVCMTATGSMVSLYIQGALRESLTTTGFVITAMSMAWAMGSILCGLLIGRVGLKWVMVIGTLFLLGGFSKLAFFSSHDSMIAFVGAVACVGMGLGILVNSTIVGVQGAAERHFVGRTLSLLSLVRAGGAGVGSAISGLIQLFSFRYYLLANERGVSEEVSTLLVSHPERFLEAGFASKTSASEFSLLQKLFAASIENVFYVPLIALFLLLPLCYLLPFATRQRLNGG